MKHTWIFLPFLLLANGCASGHFAAAKRQDSIASYERYLAAHPKGEHLDQARERLELLRYRAARRADRPLAYRAYLASYPRGKHVAACRQRLAALALGRARTAADYKLLLERYPESPAAAQAEQELPRLLASQALASGDPGPCRAFIELYPVAAQIPAVRQHLAELVYPAPEADTAALEQFVEEFAGTAQAVRASESLEALWAEEVQVLATPALLARFQQRFPQSQRLAALERAVRERRLLEATAALDLAELAELAHDQGKVGQAARQLYTYCTRRAAACKKLRLLGRRALPFQPEASLAELREGAFHADSDTSWQAIAALGLLRSHQAGATMVELLGSSRLSMVWASRRALERWLQSSSARARSLWIAFQRRQIPPLSAEEIEQRQGYLALLAGQAQGEALLTALTAEPSRALAAGYLLLRTLSARGRPVARALRERFFSAARRRLRALEESFPRELQADSLEAALLVEREGFALSQVLEELAPSSAAAPATQREERTLLRDVLAEMRRWQEQLETLGPGYASSRTPSIVEQEVQHEAQRARALHQLRRLAGFASQRVAAAICVLAAIPASCPVPNSAREVSETLRELCSRPGIR